MRESSITIRGNCVTSFIAIYSSSECVLSAELFEAASFIQTKKLGFDILIEEPKEKVPGGRCD